MKKSLIAGIVLILAAYFVQAQPQPMVSAGTPEWAQIYEPPYKTPTELPADSLLRKELFGLLRLKATPRYRFEGSLKAYRNWAVFLGKTVDMEGKSIKNPPMDNDDAAALWLRTKDGWELVDFSFGHSDAFYIIWPEQYGVPGELVGIFQKQQTDKTSELKSPSHD